MGPRTQTRSQRLCVRETRIPVCPANQKPRNRLSIGGWSRPRWTVGPSPTQLGAISPARNKCVAFGLSLDALNSHVFACVWKQKGVITQPCPNSNGGLVKPPWMSNYIPHKTTDVITYSWRNLRKIMLVKRKDIRSHNKARTVCVIIR